MPPDPISDASEFVAACVQLRSGVDRRVNIDAAKALIETAARRGATFIATPEMTNVVDQNARRLLGGIDREADAFEVSEFASLAARLQIWLLVGSLALRDDQEANDSGAASAVNRSFLFAPDGAIAARYDKIHMFDVVLPDGESWRESSVYKPGSSSVVAATGIATFGLSICYDLRFPGLYRRLSQSGAEILTAPAAFTRQTGEAHWETLLRARAIENGAYMIAPGQGGRHEDGRETYGRSMIVDPWGRILASADHDEPGVILASINLEAVRDARRAIPNLALEKAPEIIKFTA